MTHALIRYQTVGTEVYDSETGPTLGHDNIETGFCIRPSDFDGDDFDPETYSKVEVLGELSDNDIRALYRSLGKIILRIGA